VDQPAGDAVLDRALAYVGHRRLPLQRLQPVPGAVRQLRHSLRVSGLARAVAAYFSPEEDFAGLSFTCLGSNPVTR